MSVLAAILAAKEEELAALAATRPPAILAPSIRTEAALARPAGGPMRLIAEIKRRSPSAGPLSTVLSVGERAVAYARAGAAMISVLCDARFFDGGFAHLVEARHALDGAGFSTPLLAKEFVLGERQIDEAHGSGASSVLLIARIVTAPRLAALVAHARALGLEPLVEVVTEEELAAALDADARVIGVNARDLDTLVMDPVRAARVLAAIARGDSQRVAVHLSGLKDAGDVATVSRSGVSAALIGEALMRKDDPSELLRGMVAAA